MSPGFARGAVALAVLSGATKTASAQGVTGGAREIVSLSFANTPVGEFPKQLTYRNGSLEVVEKNGVHMLMATTPSEFLIPLPETLPDPFTVEFDVIAKESGSQADLAFGGSNDPRLATSSVDVIWSPSTQQVTGGGTNFRATTPPSIRDALPGQLGKVLASFDGGTLKLYTNGERLYTISDVRFARGQVLRVALGGVDEKQAVYLARVRIAAGVATTSVVAQQSAVTGSLATTAGTTIRPAGGTPPATVATQPTVVAPASAGAIAREPVLKSQPPPGSSGVLGGTTAPAPPPPPPPPPPASGSTVTLNPRAISLSGFTATGGFSSLAPRTIALNGFAATGMFTALVPRTISLSGFTAAGTFGVLAPRTILLSGFSALGLYGSLSQRTVDLTGFTAAGIFGSLSPRILTLSGFTAAGVFPTLAPRTISLSGFTAAGTFTTLAPRTINLSGWTAVGVIP